MFDYTVIGGKGFIGSEITRLLLNEGYSVFVPERNDNGLFIKKLGIVIYCAGHGDCETLPFKVFESNSLLLAQLLENASFEKLFYISSTRLYMGQDSASESDNLTILTHDKRRLFNLTKLVSEELCLLSGKNVAILRASNVYGLALSSPLFLPAITRNAINKKQVDMYVTPEYEKDYVAVSDVAEAVYKLSKKEKLSQKIFNIGSGKNTSAGEIANILQVETNCNISWLPGAVDDFFPLNDILALQNEIIYHPRSVLNDLKIMIDEFKSTFNKE